MASFDYNYHHQLEDINFLKSEVAFQYIEIKNFKDGREPIVNVGELYEDEIPHWLAEQESRSLPPEGCSGGLRLLMHVGPQEVFNISPTVHISRSIFVKIMETFSLPLAFLDSLSKDAGQYARFHRQNPKRMEYIIKPLSGVVQYTNGLFSYVLGTGFAYGLLRTNFTLAVPELIRNLQSSAASASHPMLFPIVFAEWQMSRLCSISFRCNAYLFRIEDMTGHPVIKDRKSDPKLDNHRDLTLQLSRVSYQIAAGELFTGCLTELCDFITESLEYMLFRQSEKSLQPSQDADQSIHERLRRIKSSARHAKLKFNMYEKRTQFQLSTVKHLPVSLSPFLFDISLTQGTANTPTPSQIYNLIAQKDRVLNMEIAKDSKSIAAASRRDSASMKIIAVLTTSFLPATWVSSLFSMPLFNWNAAAGQSVLGDRFWVYWTLTLPLTVLVMAAMWSWMSWRERRNVAEDQTAREMGGVAEAQARPEMGVQGLPYKFSVSTHDVTPGAFESLRRRLGRPDVELELREKDDGAVEGHGVELA